ncbi:PLC-like phosphodiesterase [Trametopsis cervina]|nr:PLC-like phosphodiesterase [Trametopsis cervina]
MLTFSKDLTQAVFTLLATSLAAHALSIQGRATTCNGHAELCERNYGNVTFVGTHDSYAVGTNNLATNQDYDVTQQLTDGVRLLQVEALNQNGTPQLCHSSCTLQNGGSLQDYLTKVKTWMDSNPNDVVTMLITNTDGLPPSAFDTVYKAVGLDTASYTPPSAALPASGWPTLGSLIDGGTRLVSFLAQQADFTQVPYLIDEFTNVWETAFDVTDTTFDCNVNRTKGDTSTQMYLINHFLDKPSVFGIPTPDVANANTTNAVSGVGSLGAQVDTCAAQNGRNPNFLLVDFYEYGGGSVFQVAATANGVTYDPTTPIATPKAQGGSSSSNTTPSGSAPSTSVTTSSLSGARGTHSASGYLWWSLAITAASGILGASAFF